MYLTVQYLREINNQPTECWSFAPLTLDVEEALIQARDGQAAAGMHFGASSFRVVNSAGEILALETIAPPPWLRSSSLYSSAASKSLAA